MLLNLREYHRPSALDEALALLARPGIRTVPLAGGDALLGSGDPAVEAVVDLQGLGLDAIAEDGERACLRIGAMVRRAGLAADERVQGCYAGVIAQAAGRWPGSLQRNRGTLGGALAMAAPDDPLVVAMLACEAVVVLHSQAGAQEVALADFLPHRLSMLAALALITEVWLPLPVPGTAAAMATVARTPADWPIVVAVAVLEVEQGRCRRVRLALGGVADRPVRLPEVEQLLEGHSLTAEAMAGLEQRVKELVQPCGDFRGSAEYRQAMAGVLSRRAVSEALIRC